MCPCANHPLPFLGTTLVPADRSLQHRYKTGSVSTDISRIRAVVHCPTLPNNISMNRGLQTRAAQCGPRFRPSNFTRTHLQQLLRHTQSKALHTRRCRLRRGSMRLSLLQCQARRFLQVAWRASEPVLCEITQSRELASGVIKFAPRELRSSGAYTERCVA